MDTVAKVAYVLLAIVAIFKVIGIPPISYWFRCKECPTCRGVGWLRK